MAGVGTTTADRLIRRRTFTLVQMAIPQPIECDVVLESSQEVLVTLSLPIVPHQGEEIDLDLTGTRAGAEGIYVVRAVRYHMRPRKLTRHGDLFGVRVVVSPVL